MRISVCLPPTHIDATLNQPGKRTKVKPLRDVPPPESVVHSYGGSEAPWPLEPNLSFVFCFFLVRYVGNCKNNFHHLCTLLAEEEEEEEEKKNYIHVTHVILTH